MLAKIQKWGNSLAVRIPKALADEAGLERDKQVDIRYEDGELRISTRRRKRYDLDELLASVPDDYDEGEWDTGRQRSLVATHNLIRRALHPWQRCLFACAEYPLSRRDRVPGTSSRLLHEEKCISFSGRILDKRQVKTHYKFLTCHYIVV